MLAARQLPLYSPSAPDESCLVVLHDGRPRTSLRELWGWAFATFFGREPDKGTFVRHRIMHARRRLPYSLLDTRSKMSMCIACISAATAESRSNYDTAGFITVVQQHACRKKAALPLDLRNGS
jgi:hypothetical protein